MPREYLIIANPNGVHFEAVKEAVQAVNGLQSYFRCDLRSDTKLLSSKCKSTDPDVLARKIQKEYKAIPMIALTEQYYSSGYLVEERLPTLTLVTCADWDDGEQPPLRLFLIYSIASALITFAAGLTPEQNKAMAHSDLVGCMFDWWSESKELRLDLVAARLCPSCRAALGPHLEEKDTVFQAIQNILDFVRRSILGDAVTLPRKIWIIHGTDPDWKDLRTMLMKWGLEVDEFNEMNVAGVPIVQRWRQMANSARFAFAFLTEDEVVTKERRLPRLNVAHEVGLCHARLGLEGTFILRQGEAEVFTNLSGIVYMQYQKGRLAEMELDIKQLLVQRGVLAA